MQTPNTPLMMMIPEQPTEQPTEQPLPLASALVLPANVSLSTSERLEDLLAEAQAELLQLAPQIEQLEEAVVQLHALKQKRQRLLGLKSSLSALLLPTHQQATMMAALPQPLAATEEERALCASVAPLNNTPSKPMGKINKAIKRQLPLLPPTSDGVFLPELAFKQGDTILKRKDSINYEIFRAIVYQGGQASTQQIRQYLMEQGVTVPKTGELFETVTLSEISARVSYLVKHGIVRSIGAGRYLSCFGWDQPVQ
jgi:hypothetical protein